MHHNCVGKNNRKLAFMCCLMAVVNANKPGSLKVLITVTIMLKDELMGNRGAIITLHVAHVISQFIMLYNHTSPIFS